MEKEVRDPNENVRLFWQETKKKKKLDRLMHKSALREIWTKEKRGKEKKPNRFFAPIAEKMLGKKTQSQLGKCTQLSSFAWTEKQEFWN